MSVIVDIGDRSTELGWISGSYAVLTLVHWNEQPEPDPVDSIDPL